jgi:hypothetical protein
MGFQPGNQPIITSNYYEVLANLKESVSKTTVPCHMHGKGRKKKDNLLNSRHKILIVGDSHVRRMAAKL